MNTSTTGHLVIVVGPSGAGKDSLLNAAKERYKSESRVEFVRRVITRECDPDAEVHDSVTESEFLLQQQHNAFSVWWQANGLYYGLPAATKQSFMQGRLLIANGSRAALPAIRAAFPALTVVHVTANASELAARLARRSREAPAQIEARLLRNQTLKPIIGDDVVTIDNSGARDIAIERFLRLISKHLS